jgi:1,4-dihydroxy-2-naphthoyl-CoA hydrolase
MDTLLQQLKERSRNTMVEHLGIEFLEAGKDFLAGRMPVDHRTVQPLRLLHGGASVAFAETLGSMAAVLQVDADKQYCLGLEINANHLRPVPETGWVFGWATALHIGRKTQVWEIKITNEQDKLVCISRITIAVMDRD